MYRNYLVSAWRNVIGNGMFSAINILGLSVGLMSCILILLFVRQEVGFDTWLKDSDRLVRVHSAYLNEEGEPFETVRSVGRMVNALKNYAKNEVDTGARLIPQSLIVHHDGNPFPQELAVVDGDFFDVFDLPFIQGDKSTSFKQPLDLVITEKVAQKYFGTSKAVGQTITVCCYQNRESVSLQVTGVIKDLPSNTHLEVDMLLYLQPSLFAGSGVLRTWGNNNVYSYFKLNSGVTPEQFQQRIDHWLNNESPFAKSLAKRVSAPANAKVTDRINYRVMGVPDLHLHAIKHAGNMGDLSEMGDADMINAFSIVAVLVLIIACINFMNLSTAKASKRACEVAIRKVAGASQSQITAQFLIEAIALVLISLLIALIAVELVLPFYNELLGHTLTLNIFQEPLIAVALVGVAVLVGIGSGLYPAIYLSRFSPGKILTSSKNNESSGSAKLRLALVVFQFVISIVLMISTVVIYGQTVFATSIDKGYQSDDKLIFYSGAAKPNTDSLKYKLMDLPEVNDVVFSSEVPTVDHQNTSQFTLLKNASSSLRDKDAETLNLNRVGLNIHRMDYGFFEAYKVKPIAGRLFDKAFGSDALIEVPADNDSGQPTPINASAILNESAVKRLGFASPQDAIGQVLSTSQGKVNLTIIGVIPDLYFRSIKFGIRASIYTLEPSRFNITSLSVNTHDIPNLIRKIEEVWSEEVSMTPISVYELDFLIEHEYSKELSAAQLFLGFSILAIVIACLGLYGLSAFTVERRTKEIGIRKVMGASVGDIVRLLVWQFSIPVIIANIIAWPIAAYFSLGWLEGFSYRFDELWLLPIFLSISLLSLLIAWITVASNAAHVAHKKPVYSLRYE
jgi:putative ABC transport system permease protein